MTIETLERREEIRTHLQSGYDYAVDRIKNTDQGNYVELETELATNLMDVNDGLVDHDDLDAAFKVGAWYAVSDVTFNPLCAVRQRLGRELVGSKRR